MPDLFEQLAELPVPPVPPVETFDRAIHQRINSRLVVGQMLDLATRGFAFGIVHFCRAVGGAVKLSLTGKLETDKNRKSGRDA